MDAKPCRLREGPQRNSLANQGIVCWSDAVTHAEWYVEVVETYCKTVMIASQLRPKLKEIPPEKIAILLAIKRKWDCWTRGLASDTKAIEWTATSMSEPTSKSAPARQWASYEIDEMISRLTAEVSGFLLGTE